MTEFMRRWLTAATVAILIGAVAPASAVIKVDYPVSQLYKDAEIVALAEVTRVEAGGGFTCAVGETLKGRLPDAGITLAAPAALSRELKARQPAVLFIRRTLIILHVGDAWHQGTRLPGERWAISGPYPMAKNYPGRTAGLAAIVRDIQAGRKAIQDGIGHEFVGSLQDRGNLGVTPTFLAVTDADGDAWQDLVVCTSGGVRLFLGADGSYRDATERWGLKDAPGKMAACGDVDGDGRGDLLIGKTLWLRQGERFLKSDAKLDLPGEETWASVALTDADGDKRTDVAVVTRTGSLKTAMNPGAKGGDWPVKSVELGSGAEPALAAVFSRDWGDDGECYVLVVHGSDIVRYPVGRAGAPRSDFKRLTGVALSDYPKIGPTPLRVDLCTALDYDGNGRMDLLLVTRGGGITLANRGYGTMLINAFMPTQFRTESPFKAGPKIPKLPFAVDSSLCPTVCNRTGKSSKNQARNLLLLRADGQLFELVNLRL